MRPARSGPSYLQWRSAAVAQNTALYSLIGTTFGGNTEQFALPDLSAAVPTNYNYYIAVQGAFPQSGQ